MMLIWIISGWALVSAIFLMIFIVNSIFNVWEPVAEEYQKLTGHSLNSGFMNLLLLFS